MSPDVDSAATPPACRHRPETRHCGWPRKIVSDATRCCPLSSVPLASAHAVVSARRCRSAAAAGSLSLACVALNVAMLLVTAGRTKAAAAAPNAAQLRVGSTRLSHFCVQSRTFAAAAFPLASPPTASALPALPPLLPHVNQLCTSHSAHASSCTLSLPACFCSLLPSPCVQLLSRLSVSLQLASKSARPLRHTFRLCRFCRHDGGHRSGPLLSGCS